MPTACSRLQDLPAGRVSSAEALVLQAPADGDRGGVRVQARATLY